MGSLEVLGETVDDQTRCVHWRGKRDVVAFRFPCCGDWYPCRACHDEAVEHQARVWGLDQRGQEAVLCGVCRETMSIQAYVDSGHTCPSCGVAFNPGCRSHWPGYFNL